MSPAHILIIEDEEKLAHLLRDYLLREEYSVACCFRGDTYLTAMQAQQPDLILLDLQLPGMNGLDICRAVRSESDVPIIMLTARVDEIDRLLGLELGADDYICKPFSPREVVARVKAVLRRTQQTVQPRDAALLQWGPITLDEKGHQVQVNSELLELTPVEFSLLWAMLKKPREVLSRQQLLNQAKGNVYEGYERNIDSHIKNLRKKLKVKLDGKDPFRTVYGVGYQLQPLD